MKYVNSVVLAVAILWAGGAATAAEPETRAREVREAELAFAQTMADRDLDQFLGFVADDTVFFGQGGVLRGVEAVKAAWRPFFAGPTAPFSWEPEVVEVLDSGDLAFSSGPVRDAQGRRVGTFNSIWRRGAQGRWKVVFDKGCPPCDCSSKGSEAKESP